MVVGASSHQNLASAGELSSPRSRRGLAGLGVALVLVLASHPVPYAQAIDLDLQETIDSILSALECGPETCPSKDEVLQAVEDLWPELPPVNAREFVNALMEAAEGIGDQEIPEGPDLEEILESLPDYQEWLEDLPNAASFVPSKDDIRVSMETDAWADAYCAYDGSSWDVGWTATLYQRGSAEFAPENIDETFEDTPIAFPIDWKDRWAVGGEWSATGENGEPLGRSDHTNQGKLYATSAVYEVTHKSISKDYTYSGYWILRGEGESPEGWVWALGYLEGTTAFANYGETFDQDHDYYDCPPFNGEIG